MKRSCLNPDRATLSRREFFQRSAVGLGAMALGSLWPSTSFAKPTASTRPLPHFPARAKRVIFLHMTGGPQHRRAMR